MRDISAPRKVAQSAVPRPIQAVAHSAYTPHLSIPSRRNPWRLALIPAVALAVATGGAIGYGAAQLRMPDAKPATVSALAATAPASSAPRATAAQIQATLDNALAGVPASASASVIDLTNGVTAGRNADQQMVSASLYKLFVALAVYKQIDDGGVTLSDTASNGQTISYCLDKMITISDNECGMALGSLVGWSKQNSMLEKDGFTKTRLSSTEDELTSANDVALLLKRLQAGSLLSPVNTGHFLELLKAQRINNRLPAGLPSGVEIGHKTGDLNSLVHDAGVVYAPNGEYVIVMMTDNWSSVTDAPAAFSKVSRDIYSTFMGLK